MDTTIRLTTSARLLVACLLLLSAGGFIWSNQSRADEGQPVSRDIVDTAIAGGSFKTLVRALQAADLVEALRGKGPYTVFAPTDEAFSALPAGTLENLLKPENKERLKSVLLYHVVSGRVLSRDIKGEVRPQTLAGSTLDIKPASGGVAVNDATVTSADIMASNGVIHVVDGVLLPAS
ncbi:MAG: fasciclin domain-containing protein [Gammaproteobacteria bacterium]